MIFWSILERVRRAIGPATAMAYSFSRIRGVCMESAGTVATSHTQNERVSSEREVIARHRKNHLFHK